MAGRPRDERGRFISRAAAEAKGIAWPTSGSGTSASSSASRATPSYNSTSSYSSTPSYNSTSSYRSTTSYSAATSVYVPPAPVSVPSASSSFAASRPRDERGRFISREAAAAQGISWPTSGSGANASSSASRATPSYNSTPSYTSTPSNNSPSPYKATPSYNTATSVYVPPVPVSVPSPSSSFAASRPRDERGRFISREAAAAQGISWPTSGSVTTSSASQTASANPLSTVTPVETTPKKITKTRSEAAKERPRDEKGRFIAAEKSITPTGDTNIRPRDSKGRFVKRLVLPPTQSDSESLPPTLESNSESTNRRRKPRNPKARSVKLSEASETELQSSDLAKNSATKRTTKKNKTTPVQTTPHPAASRPRDEKGRFISREAAEAQGIPFPSMDGVPRDEKGRFTSEIKAAQATDNNSTPSAKKTTKTRSDAAKERLRDSKGRFVKRTEANKEADSAIGQTLAENSFDSEGSYDKPDLINFNNDFEYPTEPYYANRDLQSSDRNWEVYDQTPPYTTMYEQQCPYIWKKRCPDGYNCPYLHQDDVASSLATQNSEESSESESSSESEIFIEDRGTQTEEWIAFKECQSVIQKGNLLLQRMMGNPAIKEVIRKRDPLILSDLCELFMLQPEMKSTFGDVSFLNSRVE